jgi:hypothetical protein
METLLTILYEQIDDGYQAKGQPLMKAKGGCRPALSDSEVMTLMVAEDYIPDPAESQYLGLIRANSLRLFPRLLEQSQFNRPARRLRYLVEAMRRDWLMELGVDRAAKDRIDPKPVPVLGCKRSPRPSAFGGSADYGYCASRNLHYFGSKLVRMTRLDGLPVIDDLVPANTEARPAAEAGLDLVTNAESLGDKGFLGVEWPAPIHPQTGNTLTTPKRKNQ